MYSWIVEESTCFYWALEQNMVLGFSACTVFALCVYIMIHSLYLSGNYISVCGRGGERNLETKAIYVSDLQFCFINHLSYWKSRVLSLSVFIVWIAVQSEVESALPSRYISWRRNSRNRCSDRWVWGGFFFFVVFFSLLMAGIAFWLLECERTVLKANPCVISQRLLYFLRSTMFCTKFFILKIKNFCIRIFAS